MTVKHSPRTKKVTLTLTEAQAAQLAAYLGCTTGVDDLYDVYAALDNLPLPRRWVESGLQPLYLKEIE